MGYSEAYRLYTEKYSTLAVCNHKQLDVMLMDPRLDSLERLLEAMHSCVGATGNYIPLLGLSAV